MKVYLVFDTRGFMRNHDLVSIWADKEKAKNIATKLSVYHTVEDWDVNE